MMEMPRRLAVDGAQLLVDSTALVLGPTGVNAQIEYILEVRAWENGCFLAVANKCGYEAGMAHYAGRSAIFGPDGLRLAEGAPDRPEKITVVIDVDSSKGPPVSRRPDGYRQLIKPMQETRIARALSNPPPARPMRLALIHERGDEERLRRELAADLILTPWEDSRPRSARAGRGRSLVGSKAVSKRAGGRYRRCDRRIPLG